MIELTTDKINTDRLLAQACQPEAGAVVLFLGITRELTAGRRTVTLDYEAYELMARHELEKLEAQARHRWSLVECLIVHRLGRVPVADASVAIVTSAPHRREAFVAGQWIIDTLKQTVPIWKCEQWADGNVEWIHPGMNVSDDDAPTRSATSSP